MATTTDINICNQALGFLGKNSIASFNDNTEEARQCTIHYAASLDFVLRQNHWNFAIKRIVLAALSNAPLDWSYMYAYPQDCIEALKIITGTRVSAVKIPFEVGLDDNSTKVILTDMSQASLLFVARVSNAAQFDAAFAEVLSWWLAHKMAMPLTGNRQLAVEAQRSYDFSLRQAVLANANEGTQDVPPDSEFDTVRN